MPVPEGTRFRLADHTGTVRFVGAVDNTTGVWLGVEWDDPTRGKHDGVKDGKRYFSCRAPNAGSFIRPTSNISYGSSFLEALHVKYVEQPHGSRSQEKVVLGSSNGAIEVEAVDLDKIRAKFANLECLHEVSLDTEFVSRYDEPVGSIRATCPSIRGLDLSMSLIPSWDIIASICVELPALQRLSLNRTRLFLSGDIRFAFTNLIELRLSATLMAWKDMQQVTTAMPALQTIELGYNLIEQLSSEGGLVQGSTIKTINLDSNNCHDWAHICDALQPYTLLERVVLTSNKIGEIPPPKKQMLRVEHLSLSHNHLKSWDDVDALSAWCPKLNALTLVGNPLFDDPAHGRIARQLAIARIPSLVSLDAATISAKERIDCELFYLSHIALHGPKTDEERALTHPRWTALCQKHGRPDEPRKDQNQEKLSRRLMELNMYHCFDLPARNADSQATNSIMADAEQFTLRVLPTMTLLTLRLKVCKTMKRNASNTAVLFWLRMQDDSFARLDHDRDMQDLAWLGLESGSNIFFTIHDK
ncbi:hypothetical protein GGX14DRAFT_602135 [Mycena pura]|uniref:CAP-Gly domain-containing protein n=1 Tax=Mycena pura TaxID=153505 RepID=A0AAD6VNK1_9AGAR|nr:hypothetical protein GGX14DRAFT_602135 [Mycena pura]